MFGSWADKTILILLLVTGFNVAASIIVATSNYLKYDSGSGTVRLSWWWYQYCYDGGCSVYSNVSYISSCLGGAEIAGGVFSIVVFFTFCGLGFALLATQAAISQLRHGTTSLPGLSFGRRFLSSRLSLPKGSHPKVLVFSMPVIWVLQLVVLILMAVIYHTACYGSSYESYGYKYDVGFAFLIISFLVHTTVYLLFVFSPSEYIPANVDEPDVSSAGAVGTAQQQQQPQQVYPPVQQQGQFYYGQPQQQPQTFSYGQPQPQTFPYGQPQQQQQQTFYGGQLPQPDPHYPPPPVYGQPVHQQPQPAVHYPPPPVYKAN